jgi:transcriptional regulator with XRE-family HTH domain
MALYGNDFAKVFSEILGKSGVTPYQLAKYAYLDEAYLSRLRKGEKGNPSPETIVRICLGMAHCSNKLDLSDFEKLFNSVGRSLFPNRKSNPW